MHLNITIFILIVYFLQNVYMQEFQYKNIVLGFVIAPGTIPIGEVENVKETLRNIIEAIYNTTSPIPNPNFISRSSRRETIKFDTSNNDTAIIRTATITLLELGIDTDLENISDVSILISFAGCEETHDLNIKMNTIFGPIAHIAFTESGCQRLPQTSAITIPLTWFHWNGDLTQLFIDARNDKLLPNWRHAVVIYDVQSRDQAMDSLVRAFRSHIQFDEVTLSLFTVDSMSSRQSFTDQIQVILEKYTGSRPTKFIVICEFTKINLVLAMGKRSRLLGIEKQWLFVASDATNETDKWDFIKNNIITDGVNVAFVTAIQTELKRLAYSTNQWNDILFCLTDSLLALLTQTVENLATQELTLFNQVSDEEWDIIKPSRVDRVKNIIKGMDENLRDFSGGKCNQIKFQWKLEAGEFGPQGKQVLEVGVWSPVTGLRMNDDIFPHVTGGFRERRIFVTSMHFPPWQFIKRVKGPNNQETVEYSGLTFEVLTHLGKKLNFSYQVWEPPLGEDWGTVQSDGRWNGMMRLIMENPKIVLGAAAFTVTPERARFINFTEVLEREAVAFMVNRPSELSRILLFAEPFRVEVWLSLFATALVIGPVLYLIHRHSYYYKFHGKVNDQGLFKLKNCYWHLYSTLLQQGDIHLPESGSGQLFITFWWLFVIVCVTSYSASLVAFLTYPKIENPVGSIDHVLKRDGVKSWGFTGGTVIEDYLKKSNDPKIIELYQKAIIHPVFNDSVLEAIKNEEHAYIDWEISLMARMKDAFIETGVCDYTLGEERIFEEKIALAVPRGSPYLPLFNQEIKKMLQTGLFKKWKARYWPGNMKKCFSAAGTLSSDSKRTVKLRDMQGCFYLLFMGAFISFVVLVGEILIFRRKNKRRVSQVPIIEETK